MLTPQNRETGWSKDGHQHSVTSRLSHLRNSSHAPLKRVTLEEVNDLNFWFLHRPASCTEEHYLPASLTEGQIPA